MSEHKNVRTLTAVKAEAVPKQSSKAVPKPSSKAVRRMRSMK